MGYSGLSSASLCSLRQSLLGADAKFFVVRNKIAARVFNDLNRQELVGCIDGPCGFVFVKEEPINVSKILCEFLKQNQQLKLQGGFFEETVLKKEDIEAMSKIPSKEVLRYQVVAGLNSPIAGFVRTLNQILRNFVYCLDQIKQKKQA